MSMAYKINYSTVYPKVTYPITPQALALTPLLQKSLEWQYENEYRSILLPFAQNQHTINDGESVKISSNSIKQVIFGARMDNDKKLEILEIIRMSKFNPEVWQAEIAESEFKLEFVKFKPM